MRKCKLCGTREAIWAMQCIASDEPSFYKLGSHIRGFGVIPTCDDCRKVEQAKHEAAKH